MTSEVHKTSVLNEKRFRSLFEKTVNSRTCAGSAEAMAGGHLVRRIVSDKGHDL
jgi:hypothetical protein